MHFSKWGQKPVVVTWRQFQTRELPEQQFAFFSYFNFLLHEGPKDGLGRKEGREGTMIPLRSKQRKSQKEGGGGRERTGGREGGGGRGEGEREEEERELNLFSSFYSFWLVYWPRTKEKVLSPYQLSVRLDGHACLTESTVRRAQAWSSFLSLSSPLPPLMFFEKTFSLYFLLVGLLCVSACSSLGESQSLVPSTHTAIGEERGISSHDRRIRSFSPAASGSYSHEGSPPQAGASVRDNRRQGQ